ncbi:DRTGG domain-containing protein [Desulfonispora thiosulfatigenes]|uniref:DRTGG domain-containing protein n=1 Tax=Desulfonispora thiosulfatigenes TaxID=83661 RepID=UPI000A00A5FE
MKKIVLTKHEIIIQYIKNLEISTKVSVRQIAKELDVSEGTAYRAIKEAENKGLVSSIPKVGTIRIEEEEEKELEDFSLKEIIIIVEGEVLTGQENLSMTPEQFLIGASSKEIFERDVEKPALLIVGDRVDLQLAGLNYGSALLITGAVDVKEEVLKKAKELGLPIIKSPYDTFLATSMINKAVYERLKAKELVRVEDIMTRNIKYISPDATVFDWHELAKKTGRSRFPVVDQYGIVVGIVTAVDIAGVEPETSILAVMNADVLTAERKTLVTHLSRLLVWEGFELVPVVDEQKHLLGTISRRDILKAFQQTQRQPKFGETVDNLTLSGFKLEEWEGGVKLSGEITQFMVSELGTASIGTVVMIMSTAAYIAIRKKLRWDAINDTFTIHQMNPPAVGDKVEVLTTILKSDKKTCMVEIEFYSDSELKAKAMTTAKAVRK